jgi:hypothetical protein
VNVKLNFIDQHLSILVELPLDYSKITVFDFVKWATEKVDNQEACDILMAIKNGYVSSFNYLRTNRVNGTRHPIDNRKKLAEILWSKENQSNKTGNITLSAPFSLPCTRCGLCCYDEFRREYLGSTPPDDGVYFVEINNTPCKVHVPEKMHPHELGIPIRCAYLIFDTEIGLYGCKIHDGIRSPVCGFYSCDHMILNKKDCLESKFGNISTFPECNACEKKGCATCSQFPVQIEWFIAFIRHNKISTRDVEVAEFLIKKINEYELVLKTNDNSFIKMYADARWFDPYKKQLEEIVFNR